MKGLDYTFYIIKPDAFKMKDAIINDILQDGRFKIISQVELTLDKDTIEEIYYDEVSPFRERLIDYMSRGPIQAGIICGNNAIEEFTKFVGLHYDPKKCDPGTLRYKYGNPNSINYEGVQIFHNAIHRSNKHEVNSNLELYWSKMKYSDIKSKVVSIVQKKKDSEERLTYHITPVVEYGAILAKKFSADEQVVELACYLHDITRMTGDVENHHVSGAKFAENLLKNLGYPKRKIELIKNCILNHRGSINNRRQTIEEKIVASADAMAIITRPLPIFFAAYNKRNLNFNDGKIFIKDKVIRSWNKIEFDHAKDMVRPDYEWLLRILE